MGTIPPSSRTILDQLFQKIVAERYHLLKPYRKFGPPCSHSNALRPDVWKERLIHGALVYFPPTVIYIFLFAKFEKCFSQMAKYLIFYELSPF